MSGLIEPDVAERVLSAALASGGEFAEVFAERRRGTGDGNRRVADRIGPVRCRGGRGGARRRGTDHLFRARRRPRPGRPREGGGRGRVGAARRRGRATRAGGRGHSGDEAIERRPEEVPAQRKAALLRELDERGRAEGAEVAQLLASYAEAGARSRSPTPRASSPGTSAPGCGSASRRSPAAAPRSRPAPRRWAVTGASSCSKTTRARSPRALPARP